MSLKPPPLDSILGNIDDIPEIKGFPPPFQFAIPNVSPDKTTKMGKYRKHRNAGIPMLSVKTDLKSLKFSGGESSNANDRPFIQTQIPDSLPSPTGPDFLTRQNFKFVKNALIDVERLGKWFTTPAGLVFIAKQEVLSLASVRTQAFTIVNGGIYNPINTLFEAGVTGLGMHISKQGLLPNTVPRYGSKGVMKRVIGNDKDPITDISSNSDNTNRLIDLLADSVLDPNRVNIRLYQGGPGSILGLGFTRIRFATDQLGSPIHTISQSTSGKLDLNGIFQLSENGITPGSRASQINTKIIDFRAATKNPTLSLPYNGTEARNIESRLNLGNPGAQNLLTPIFNKKLGKVQYVAKLTVDRKNYVTGNSEFATGGVRPTTAGTYGAAGSTTFDKINALPLYKSTNVNGGEPASQTNDLVQFRISAIDGDTPGEKIFMHFRAFLDTISDNYTSEWNPIKYVGRGENFYTYQGFDRKVSFGFTVAAQSKAELIPMYKKLNFLASNLAPDYSPSRGFMRGPLMQLSIGGYFYEQPGFITSLTYEISQDNTWEIGIGLQDKSNQIIAWSDGSVKELPHVIKVTVQFTPIHEFRPQKLQFANINKGPTTFGLDGDIPTDERTLENIYNSGDSTFVNYPTTRYIALANGTGPDKNNYDNFLTERPVVSKPEPNPTFGPLSDQPDVDIFLPPKKDLTRKSDITPPSTPPPSSTTPGESSVFSLEDDTSYIIP